MILTSRIDVSAKWSAEIARRTNAAIPVAMKEATDVGAAVASSAAKPRARANDKMAKVASVSVKPTGNGWIGGFRSEAGKAGEFYSGFQSRGTLESRRIVRQNGPGGQPLRVKQSTIDRRKSPSGAARYAKVAGRKGITPLMHEEQGLKAARQYLIRRIQSMI